ERARVLVVWHPPDQQLNARCGGEPQRARGGADRRRMAGRRGLVWMSDADRGHVRVLAHLPEGLHELAGILLRDVLQAVVEERLHRIHDDYIDLTLPKKGHPDPLVRRERQVL